MSDTDLTAFIEARLDEARKRVEEMRHEPEVDDEYSNCPATRWGPPFGYAPQGECTCQLAERKAEALRWVNGISEVLAGINRADAESTAVDNIAIDCYVADDLRRAIAGIWPEQPSTAPVPPSPRPKT